MQTIKNLGVSSLKLFFLIMGSLREVKEGICSSIGFVLIIIYPKIIFRKLLSSLELTRAQNFFIHKLLNVVVVGKDEDFMLIALQIVPPRLKSFHNG